MAKKTITKEMIMKVYGLTIDTQPFYETKGKTHFERIIDWLELNDYNITDSSVNRIYKYMEQRSEVIQQIKYINNLK